MAVKLPTVGEQSPMEREVTTCTVCSTLLEIVSDSGRR